MKVVERGVWRHGGEATTDTVSHHMPPNLTSARRMTADRMAPVSFIMSTNDETSTPVSPCTLCRYYFQIYQFLKWQNGSVLQLAKFKAGVDRLCSRCLGLAHLAVGGAHVVFHVGGYSPFRLYLSISRYFQQSTSNMMCHMVGCGSYWGYSTLPVTDRNSKLGSRSY